MNATIVDSQGALLWGKVPDPECKPNEVLVRVRAAGVNRADLLQRQGAYPPPLGWPDRLGLEVSGLIVGVGSEAAAQSSYHPGDRVCALLGGGGYAELVAVPYQLLLPVPPSLTLEEAAGVPEVYATAYLNLFTEAALQPGETLLVHAAASGVGLAATQLARAHGARVIATVRSDAKAATIQPYGAHLIVNSRTKDLRRLFDDHSIDVVLDCVGGPLMGECFGKMARQGRWIVIATLGGDKTEIDLKTLFLKRLKLVGSTLRSRTLQEKAAVLGSLARHVLPAFESGAYRPVIYDVLPIAEAERAHRILESNENIGKVVLQVSTGS